MRSKIGKKLTRKQSPFKKVFAILITVVLFSAAWLTYRSMLSRGEINEVATGTMSTTLSPKVDANGCYYKQVQCAQAPCPPVLSCPPGVSPVPTPQQMCTQIAGSCIGFDGTCVSFKDGCEMNKLCNPKQPADGRGCGSYKPTPPPPAPPVTSIPPNCTSWFDGCNTCSVKDGTIIGCTDKACRTDFATDQPQPRCLAYGVTTTPKPSQLPQETPIPSGCRYQKVQCIQAPCEPILVCSVTNPPAPKGVISTFAASIPCGDVRYKSFQYTCLNGQKYAEETQCLNIKDALTNAQNKCRLGL